MAYHRFAGYRARTRSAMIRYVCVIGLTVLLAAILQVSLLSRFRIMNTVPDLTLCTLLCIAFFTGRQTGAVAGIAAGFLIESVGSSGIMLLPLFYMLYGYVVGHYARGIVGKQFSSYAVYLALTLLFRAALTVTYGCLLYRDLQLMQLLIGTVLPEALLTAAVGCILYLPMRGLCARLGKVQ